MTWNHRAVKTDSCGEHSYAVHEVYYSDEGIPTGCTGPVSPAGETLDELQKDLARFMDAINKPVLDYSIFTGAEIPIDDSEKTS